MAELEAAPGSAAVTEASRQRDSGLATIDGAVVLDHSGPTLHGSVDVTVALPRQAGPYIVLAVAQNEGRYGFGKAIINVAEPTRPESETAVELAMGDWLYIPDGAAVEVSGGLSLPPGQARVLAARPGPGMAAVADPRGSWAYRAYIRPNDRQAGSSSESLGRGLREAEPLRFADRESNAGSNEPRDLGAGADLPADSQRITGAERLRSVAGQQPTTRQPTTPAPQAAWAAGFAYPFYAAQPPWLFSRELAAKSRSSPSVSVAVEPAVGAVEDDFRLQVELSDPSPMPAQTRGAAPRAGLARIEIGLPSGLSATASTIASLESQDAQCKLQGGRLMIEVALAPGGRRVLAAPLFAKLRGAFTGRATTAYFIAEPEKRTEAPPLHVEIR